MNKFIIICILLSVVSGIGCLNVKTDDLVILNPTYPESRSVYSEYSDIDYPININTPSVWKGWLYFDEYSVKELGSNLREVMVQGYWYADNNQWKKCDGKFVFRTNELFVPCVYQKTQFQVVSQECGENK